MEYFELLIVLLILIGAFIFSSTQAKIIIIVAFLILILFAFIIRAIVLYLSKFINKSLHIYSCSSYYIKFSKQDRKLPKSKKINMYRDLPCGSDLNRAYWVALQYGLMKNETDYLGVILLKMIKNNKITLKTIDQENDKYSFILNDQSFINGERSENKLYKYMYDMSENGILDVDVFKRWCTINYDIIIKLLTMIIDKETLILLDEGILEDAGLTGLVRTYKCDDSMRNEAIKMIGLKKFFNEFDMMDNKDIVDVHLIEEYLMYAQILGVAKKVYAKFKNVYPDIIAECEFNDFNEMIVDSIIYMIKNSSNNNSL